jgi:hypothetical protein
MVNCDAHFYRKILGVPFSLPRGTVHIRRARDQTRAIEAAKLRFARYQGVTDWSLRADCFDLVCPDRPENASSTT